MNMPTRTTHTEAGRLEARLLMDWDDGFGLGAVFFMIVQVKIPDLKTKNPACDRQAGFF
jgi:hypothetical protein